MIEPRHYIEMTSCTRIFTLETKLEFARAGRRWSWKFEDNVVTCFVSFWFALFWEHEGFSAACIGTFFIWCPTTCHYILIFELRMQRVRTSFSTKQLWWPCCFTWPNIFGVSFDERYTSNTTKSDSTSFAYTCEQWKVLAISFVFVFIPFSNLVFLV